MGSEASWRSHVVDAGADGLSIARNHAQAALRPLYRGIELAVVVVVVDVPRQLEVVLQPERPRLQVADGLVRACVARDI